MKKIFFLLISISVLNFSCKKKPTNANVKIVFHNTIDGLDIVQNKLLYTNIAGNKYSVSLLKYYVTNAVLTQDDGTTYSYNNYDLIDEFNKEQFSDIEAQAIPGGHYTKLKFYLGIDKDRNHTGAQDGDLDPANAMIWNWNTGYIFSKHEGSFINSVGDTMALQYHFGSDLALSTIEIPIDLTIKGSDKKINISFDLNKFYNNPIIDFNSKSIMQSSTTIDLEYIRNLSTNTNDLFSLMSIE